MNPWKKKEIIGDATLYLGDCLEILPTLDKVDAIIADPPYGTTACKWDSIIPLQLMWDNLYLVSKNNGVIALTSQTPFDKILGVSNITMLRYEWIWEKGSATGHLNAKKMPMKAHENILIFYKNLPTYNPQKTKNHSRKISKTGKKYNSDCYGEESEKPFYDSTERYPRSVQFFSSDKQTINYHPTQKPVKLMELLIKTYSNENEIILDFVMGSGTTGVACMNLGRKFIGIEIKEKYFDIACERIENAQRQGKLFE